MYKVTFAFAAFLALQIASGNVIRRNVEGSNIADTLTEVIAQLEAELKKAVAIHEYTGHELEKFEKEIESLITRGEDEVLKFYTEVAKAIDQATDNDHNNSCKNDADENLSIAMKNAWETSERTLLEFGKKHVYPSEETGKLLDKVETDSIKFLLESWLCEKENDQCFKEILDRVQEERDYLREDLQKRVNNQQQEIIDAEPLLLKDLVETKDQVMASMKSILDKFNECIN